MDAMVNEVTINGQVYVAKDSEAAKPMMADHYVIVRTQNAGVFAGVLEDENATEITLKDARRLWYWDGAASLSQLAMEGVKNPTACKFPQEVPEIFLTQVIEIIPTTEIAQKSIKAVAIWKR